jgi:hypothetical protein
MRIRRNRLRSGRCTDIIGIDRLGLIVRVILLLHFLFIRCAWILASNRDCNRNVNIRIGLYNSMKNACPDSFILPIDPNEIPRTAWNEELERYVHEATKMLCLKAHLIFAEMSPCEYNLDICEQHRKYEAVNSH